MTASPDWGRMRAYITASAPAHSGVGRVGTALRSALNTAPDLADLAFDFSEGRLKYRHGGETGTIARGLRAFGKSAFYLSFTGRTPRFRKAFLDNQNLAFLRIKNCGLVVYDLFYLTHPDNPGDTLLGKTLYRGMGEYPFLLAISQYTRELAMERFGIPGDRIHAVPLDCDRETFRILNADRKTVLAKWSLPDRPFLLHVSSGDKRKNFLGVLSAFGILGAKHPELMLVRVGKPLHSSNRSKEEELIRRQGLAGRVRHLQGVSDSDLAELYNTCACYVFPSFAEGFGLPVLEAQACGAPCVTSFTTALAEVAGPLCLTADPGNPESIADAVEKVLVQPEMRREKEPANRKFLEGFSWEPARRLVRDWMEAG